MLHMLEVRIKTHHCNAYRGQRKGIAEYVPEVELLSAAVARIMIIHVLERG